MLKLKKDYDTTNDILFITSASARRTVGDEPQPGLTVFRKKTDNSVSGVTVTDLSGFPAENIEKADIPEEIKELVKESIKQYHT